MRLNLPVTQREYDIPEGATLVSTTDLQSRITYCNPAFIAVSGYEKEELIGQTHNIVRHPDMPAEAFRDMWETLRRGQPWSALVKNRRKNGDHYWVLANATPIMEAGQPVGYMSVRTRPARVQIAQAETIYARMRDEANRGARQLALHRGRLVPAGWRGRLTRLVRPTLARKMGAITIALVLLVQLLDRATEDAGASGYYASSVVVVLLAIAAAAIMRQMTVQPLGDATNFANRMAAGDLTARFNGQSGGEFGDLARALNQLNVNLQAVVSDVRHEVDGVQVAAGEIASGNQDLSARTEAQASNLAKTAASMVQLTSTVEQSAGSAREAANLAERAAQVAQEGNEAMGAVVATMDEISYSSGRISEIIQVIEGISFQTNILSLNAAVEAARAGEQGRGFAVVASEVRNLAQRTSLAAKEIKCLIDESVSRIAQGSKLVHTAGETMGHIVNSVQQVNTLVGEITSAALEQSRGLAQINQAVVQLDNVTQQNAAMVEELTAAASSLSSQSRGMTDAVGVFKC